MNKAEQKHIFDIYLSTPVEVLIHSADPSLVNPPRSPYSAPINTGALSDAVIRELAEHPESSDRFFEKVKADLRTDDPVSLWVLWTLLWSVQYNFCKGKANVSVPADIRNLLGSVISKNAAALKKCDLYQGANNSDGLYAEILRTYLILYHRFGDDLLDDSLPSSLDCIDSECACRFYPAPAELDIRRFESEHGIVLPEAYIEWLHISDGGDLYLPAGVQLYGVVHKPLIEVDGETITIGVLSNGDTILCKTDSETVMIYNHETGLVAEDETYTDFWMFLCQLPATEVAGL